MLQFQMIADDGSGEPEPCWINIPCVMCVETVCVDKGKDGKVRRDDLAALRLVDGSVVVVVGNPNNVAERIRCDMEEVPEDAP